MKKILLLSKMNKQLYYGLFILLLYFNLNFFKVMKNFDKIKYIISR